MNNPIEMKITLAQATALINIYDAWEYGSITEMMETVTPMIGGDGAIIVQTPNKGMWLAVEPNGYIHS